MSNSTPFTITVATALNTDPSTGVNVSSIDAPWRSFIYTGTAGDQVELWGSVDGTRFAKVVGAPVLTGAKSEITVNDRSLYYATKRLAGTTSGVLKCVGGTFASNAVGSVAGTFVYRQGAASSGNIYASLAEALNAASGVPGSRVIVDASLGQPVCEAVTYDWTDTVLAAMPGKFPILNTVTGTVFTTGLHEIDQVYVNHLGTNDLITVAEVGYVLALTNGAALAVGSSGDCISASAAATLSLNLENFASLPTPGEATGFAVNAAATSDVLITCVNDAEVGESCLAGDGDIEIEIIDSNRVSLTQGDASSFDVSVKGGDALNFGADALVGTTAVASLVPPGSRAATLLASGVPQPGALMASPGRKYRFHVQFTGDVANVGGQTMTFALMNGGTTLQTLAGIATTAGVKSSDDFIPDGAYAGGDTLTVVATPSGGLTANLSNIKAVAL